MTFFSVLPKRAPSTRAKMVGDISREPAACLFFEILVQPTAVVADSLSKRSLDVD
jgi:hypothetical protein